jgi:hypothetical protein
VNSIAMGEVANLNKARKAKARGEAKATAVENRLKFGRTKAQRTAAERERAAIAEVVDGAKREPG